MNISPFDLVILKCLEETRRDLAAQTARTMALLARLPLFVPDRTLRYYLRKLEQAGFVKRPIGPKSGWTVTTPVRQGLRAAAQMQMLAAA